MKKIKIQQLSVEAFKPFGTYTDVVAPEGPYLGSNVHSFYRDSSRYFSDFSLPLGFSPLVVKNHGLTVTGAEYHNRSCEAIMPVTDDAILHVSPANGGEYDVEQTCAFLVPKGTIVTLFLGVWHLCPLPKTKDEIHCLVILPERAYVNDFTGVELKPEQQFEMEF